MTEFDNLRNEYMQYEAAGEDYINMLDARLMSEYRSYVEEDPVAAEEYLAAGKALIRELSDWAASERHQADTDFVANAQKSNDNTSRHNPTTVHGFILQVNTTSACITATTPTTCDWSIHVTVSRNASRNRCDYCAQNVKRERQNCNAHSSRCGMPCNNRSTTLGSWTEIVCCAVSIAR